MSDRIAIQTPWGPALLDLPTLRAGLDAARTLGIAPDATQGAPRTLESAPLADATETARALSVPVSKVRAMARDGAIPVTYVGRYPRFDVAKVRQALDQRSTEPSIAPGTREFPGGRRGGFTAVSEKRGRVRPGRSRDTAQVGGK